GPRHARRARLGDQRRQHALHEHRQRHEREPRADGQRRDRFHAALVNEPRTSVNTTSEVPTSIAMPVSVLSHQYGRIVLTVSIHSAGAISRKPCCNPCVVSTSTMPTMPVAISQNPALARRKVEGVERVTRGQT